MRPFSRKSTCEVCCFSSHLLLHVIDFFVPPDTLCDSTQSQRIKAHTPSFMPRASAPVQSCFCYKAALLMYKMQVKHLEVLLLHAALVSVFPITVKHCTGHSSSLAPSFASSIRPGDRPPRRERPRGSRPTG